MSRMGLIELLVIGVVWAGPAADSRRGGGASICSTVPRPRSPIAPSAIQPRRWCAAHCAATLPHKDEPPAEA